MEADELIQIENSTYRGKPLKEMSREELMIALSTMAKLLAKEQSEHGYTSEMHRDALENIRRNEWEGMGR